MNDNNLEEQKNPLKNFKKIKIILVLFLIAIIISLGIYFFFWLQSVQKTHLESQAVVEEANNYSIIIERIKLEESRCENFISSEEGDFGSFEYCKKFIIWSDKVTSDL